MEMNFVVSDTVSKVGYSPDHHIMRVIFRNNSEYDYFGVPANLYEQMLQPHPWRRVGRQVRSYTCTRRR